VALTESNQSNGAMEVIPGSHLMDQVPHKDTFDDNNLLSRGQEVAVDIDASKAVRLDMRPGEMSLHHVRLVHGSPPNPSNGRRIGFAIRYIPTSVRQLHGDDAATPVRGVDRFNTFEHEPVPTADLQPEMVELHKQLTERNARILYRGTSIKSYSDSAARGAFR
jgi:ectoine hydroxylase-related dioxygenase (phytanoyl-CoA dioxygenase family)